MERKRRLFLKWKNSEPGEEKANEEAYRKANKQVKRVIYKAKDNHRQEFVKIRQMATERSEEKARVINLKSILIQYSD